MQNLTASVNEQKANWRRCSFLFMADGVFMYFTQPPLKPLVINLCDHFPGVDLVCDAYPPVVVRFHPRPPVMPWLCWGLKGDRDVEVCSPG